MEIHFLGNRLLKWKNRGGVLSYPYLLLTCLFIMLSIALVMYFLGTKISYNYILYNASVSIGAGVIFFLVKMIMTMDQVGPIEQMLDIGLTLLLMTVWLVALVETITVEVVENGREMKNNLISLAKWIKTVEFKEMPSEIAKRVHSFSVKSKKYLVKNKLALKTQKIFGELHKNRELNKRV